MQIGYRPVVSDIFAVETFFFKRGVTLAVLYIEEKTPSSKHNVVSRAISGANTSTQDFKTVVGMQSIGDDFPGNELISFRTSSVDGATSEQRTRPVYIESDRSGSADVLLS